MSQFQSGGASKTQLEEWSLFLFLLEIQFQGKHSGLFLALLLAVGWPWNQTRKGYNKDDANRVTDRIFGDQNPNSPRQD